MKRVLYLVGLLCVLLTGCDQLQKPFVQSKQTYHFNQPAQIWEETFPLGNGRIGLMPDGGVEKENYVLNEISMWSGSKQDTDNPEALKSLPEIRKLLFEGRNDEAQQLMYETFVCKGAGSGQGHGYNKPYGSYQILGNLLLEHRYDSHPEGAVTDYRRELSLEEAIATVAFQKDGVNYHREAFTSFGTDVAVIRLTADQKKSLQFFIGMNRPERYEVSIEGRDLVMHGRLTEGEAYKTPEEIEREATVRRRSSDADMEQPEMQPKEPEAKGVRYGARVRILLPDDGKLTTADDTTLVVEDASEAILLISMATDYFGKEVNDQLETMLNLAEEKGYDFLKSEHIEAYQKLYKRVEVDFGHNQAKEKLPMDERLNAFQKDKDDPSLLALYYQFGRYLLISSTRPGLLPPNLQGLWCNTIDTPWNGDYHLNINLQMNLWHAESGNLSELHLPFIEWTKQQVPSGQRTAKVFYNAQGWVTHILGNVWEFTAPGEHPSWGATNTSAAWLCAHLYNHYLYTQDKTYLAEVYPTMKEAALFFVDMLVEDPRHFFLVTAPTTSPENSYLLPNGNEVHICAGSTMDNQILRELFSNTIQASELLGIDKEFAFLLRNKRSRLMPTTVGSDGRIMEWLESFKEAEPHHRHVSHLYGLYPANEISTGITPELAEAARKTLEARGDESTGWSMAWKVNFWARLKDGEHAYKLLTDLLKPCDQQNVDMTNGGGTYPNLFCGHPPFQIDGNFGGSAGIAEMLIQSQDGSIDFLPALPSAWKTGRFKGLRIQGGAEVSAEWENGHLITCEVQALCHRYYPIRLRQGVRVTVEMNGVARSYGQIAGCLSVEMNPGDVLRIKYW